MLKGQFLNAVEVIDRIEHFGHQAYLVGGCVRDMLLKRPIGDIDITTSAPPTLVMEMFENVIPVGIEHGTVIVRYKEESYEVTTFRSEGEYTDHRRPDEVKFIDQIDNDLERRDFTINALAMNKHGEIIDLFMGQDDLKKKIIRTVGNGGERFSEDPLRIIRALRFSSQLGFAIETDTLVAMNKVKTEIMNLSVERIATEMEKLVKGNYIQIGFSYLRETEIYRFLPVLSKYPYIIDRIPRLTSPLDSIAELFTLFHYIEPSISIHTWSKEWKCSKRIRMDASHLSEAVFCYKDRGLDHMLVYNLPTSLHPGFMRLVNILFPNHTLALTDIESFSYELPIRSKEELDLNGHDIISMFPNHQKGPWIKITLERIEKEVVKGNLINEKNMLKEWIKWNPPEIN